MGHLNWEIYTRFLILFVVIFAARNSHGYTDPRDVLAVNGLYVALGLPPLPRWLPSGGDPCGENWQGVECVFANITAIKLSSANLGGELGDSLGLFTSVITIDLSDNHIGGSVPSNLPLTVRSVSFSANQLTGSIPNTLSTLSQLSDISLGNNHLAGGIPDAFQQLTGLVNLDLSGNSLSGQLPPSMGNLSSLTTLNLQNNQLSGVLDVLRDLPLADLDIENNLFSGPIPAELLTIPNFRKDGNPFNTTIIPAPPALSPALSPSSSPSLPPSSGGGPGKHAYGPSAWETPYSAMTNKPPATKRVIWFAVAGILILLVIALGLCLFISRCCKRKHKVDRFSKRYEMSTYDSAKENFKNGKTLIKQDDQIEKVISEEVLKAQDGHDMDRRRMDSSSKLQLRQEINEKRVASDQEDHKIDMTEIDLNFKHKQLRPHAPPPIPLAVDRVIVNRKPPAEISTKRLYTRNFNFHSSLRSFTIGSLQQYTNSFSQENLIGRGMISSVYRAELPDGKPLAVKKLDSATSRLQSDDEFLELVSSISKIRHPNVVEIVGYCAEHGQRLLVYEYCGNGTLDEALHLDDEIQNKLSWTARIKIALGVARALEYLHEVCQPPIMHQNVNSTNLLLDDKLTVRISDCGLASIMTSATISQLSRHLSAYGYGAPELELGTYTYHSDTYSFGVVMLELLTGRKSFDRTRPRGEQFLVRWAIRQLHDIDLLSRMVDPSLNGLYPSKSLSRFADIISRCIQPEPEFRPPMSEIVQDLACMI